MTFDKQQTLIHDEIGRELAAVASYHGPRVVVIKRLGWRRLAEAATELAKSGMGYVQALGGPAVVKEFQALGGEQKVREAVEAAKTKDPLLAYDQRSLVLWGAVSFDGVEKTPEAVDDLEPELAEAIARAVLRLSRPALFETEADEKNA